MKKSLNIIIISIIFVIFILNNKSYCAVSNINSFPLEYRSYLNQINSVYPNWTFTPLYTGLNWTDVINAQTAGYKSLVKKSADPWYKLNNIDAPGNLGWVVASRQAVEYAMNPINNLSISEIFQFETLSLNTNIQNIAGIESILYGTNIHNRGIQYYDSLGNIKNDLIGMKYSKSIFDAGVNSKVNPYHLAARIKQETGGDIINNLSICGRYHPKFNALCIGDYRGIYNYYNISASGTNPIANALQYAKTPGIYGEPWDNPDKSIKGGALFIGSKYINKGQNNLYLQKFNVTSNNTYGNQYMQNLFAPYNEAITMYNTYKDSNSLNFAHNFTIPIYNGAPIGDADVKYIIIVDSDIGINVRSAPSTESSIVAKIKNGVHLNVIDDSNAEWYKVRLDNGVTGYVFKEYTKIKDHIKVDNISLNKTSINLDIGTTDKLTATISPTNALFKGVKWESNNSNIVTVDQNGNITAKTPGTTQVVVTSNDQAKTAVCNVTVLDKVTSITLPQTSYTIEIGNYLTLNPTVLPENAFNKKYVTKIQNENIASVDESGRILAKAEGSTKVTLTTNVNAKSVVVDLVVVKKILNCDNSLIVDTNYISKIQPGSKVSDIINKLKPVDTNNKIVIKNKDGKVIGNNDLIGTGTKIEVQKNDGTVINTYYIIIYGDINGDGLIGALDYIAIRNNIMNELTLNNVQKKAAPYSRNGNIKALDYIAIRNNIMGDFVINQ